MNYYFVFLYLCIFNSVNRLSSYMEESDETARDGREETTHTCDGKKIKICKKWTTIFLKD